MAGRRAWSRVRSAALLESESIMRRTMRERRAGSDLSPHGDGPGSKQIPDGPQVARLRAKLNGGPSDVAELGALLLLELTEPESLTEARRYAFAATEPSREAERALSAAWDRFRHDRYRALN